MVNFMHQFDWAKGCPDTWLNIILSVSVKVFLMRLALESVDSVKRVTFPNMGGHRPVH